MYLTPLNFLSVSLTVILVFQVWDKPMFLPADVIT